MMNKKNIALAIVIACAQGSVFCTTQEAKVTKKGIIQAVAGAVVALEKETLDTAEGVVVAAGDLVEDVVDAAQTVVTEVVDLVEAATGEVVTLVEDVTEAVVDAIV